MESKRVDTDPNEEYLQLTLQIMMKQAAKTDTTNTLGWASRTIIPTAAHWISDEMAEVIGKLGGPFE